MGPLCLPLQLQLVQSLLAPRFGPILTALACNARSQAIGMSNKISVKVVQQARFSTQILKPAQCLKAMHCLTLKGPRAGSPPPKISQIY